MAPKKVAAPAPVPAPAPAPTPAPPAPVSNNFIITNLIN